MTSARPTGICLLLALAASLAAVEVGEDLSSLALPLRDGARSVGAYRGEVVYLDVWASWCGPCRTSFPWMQSVHQRFADQGLKVVAVSIDQKAGDLDSFLSRHSVDFAIGHDPQAGIAKTLAVQAMPTAVLIDRQGKARLVHDGFRTEDGEKLESTIRALLAEGE